MKIKSNEFREFIIFFSIVLLIALVFLFILFGMAGARVVLGIIFVSLPFYLMLNRFEIEEGEKYVFSIFLGLTIFPSSVYLLGLVMSFRIAIAASFIAVFTGTAVILWSRKSKKAKD